MSEDGEDDGEPVVELGDGESVEGAPLARVASRLTWGIERSEVVRREGDTTIRTPDGPRPLSEILEAVDTAYFETEQAFEAAVHDAIGRGPVATETDS